MQAGKITAVCGKGGVGKTVISGALVRTLAEMGRKVIAIDADPAMGLSFILGLKEDIKTLGSVRRNLITTARTNKDPAAVADAIDYLVMETLIETAHFSFMAMGMSQTRGCFCPINTLLKDSIKMLADNFDYVIIDAEAGLEQINREVMTGVSQIVTIIDGSQRSMHSLELIRDITSQMHMTAGVGVVLNRRQEQDHTGIIERIEATGLPLWAMVPEDDVLRSNDAQGMSIFELVPDSPVLRSTRQLVDNLIQN